MIEVVAEPTTRGPGTDTTSPARPVGAALDGPAGPPPPSIRTALRRLRRQSAVLSVVLAVAALAALGLQQHRVTVLTTVIEPQTLANQRLLQAATDMETALRGYELTRDRSFLQPFDAGSLVLQSSLTTLRAADVDAVTATDVAAQEAAVNRWLRSAYPRTGAVTVAEQTTAKADFDTIRAANAAVGEHLAALGARLDRQARVTTTAAVGVITLVGLVGMAVVRRRTRRTAEEVVPPLEALGEVVRGLDRGRRSVRADADHGVTEIRTVAGALNELAASNAAQRDTLAAQIALSDEVRTIGGLIRTAPDMDAALVDGGRAIGVGLRTEAVWIRIAPAAGDPRLPGRAVGSPDDSGPRLPVRLYGAGLALARHAHRHQYPVLLTASDPSPGSGGAAGARVTAALTEAGLGSLVIVPVSGVGSDCLGYLALGRGPTADAWTEPELEALLRIGRDLGQSVAVFRTVQRERELVARLRALDLAKDEFISTASHELRTPLTAILGHIELVHRGTLGPVPTGLAPSVAAVQRNSLRLGRLIDDLLALDRPADRRDPLELGELAREVVALQHLDAAGRAIGVAVAAPVPVWVVGDPDELSRALGNVLSNAIKFSPSGRPVAVTVRADDGRAVLEVTDQGLGISTADQDRLFTRFFRSSNPEALAIPGTGLGLTIVRSVLEKHGGAVALRSEPGVGTTVRLTLPLTSGE